MVYGPSAPGTKALELCLMPVQQLAQRRTGSSQVLQLCLAPSEEAL